MKQNSVLNLRSRASSDKVKQDNKSLAGKRMGKKRNATLRKDGRWQVYAHIENKRKACYGNTEYKANYRADIEEAKAENDLSMISRLTGEEGLTFENCFYRYRNYLLFYTNRTNETVDRYEATYLKYFPGTHLNSINIMRITEKDVTNFIINILKKNKMLTEKEYGRIQHIIKAVINFIYDEELDETFEKNNPPEVLLIDYARIKRRAKTQGKIYKPVKKEYAVSTPSREILQKKVLEDNVYPERFAYVIMLLINFSLGLRVGELAALKEENVDMALCVVKINSSCKSYKKRDEYGNAVGGYEYVVESPKTPNGERVLPMSYTAQRLFEILFEYRREKGYRSPYLAYDGENIRARVRAMSSILKELCERSEVESFNTHIIRKSFATALSRCSDIDIPTISEYMGHAQVSTTVNNYLIPARESVEERRQKLSKVV